MFHNFTIFCTSLKIMYKLFTVQPTFVSVSVSVATSIPWKLMEHFPYMPAPWWGLYAVDFMY